MRDERSLRSSDGGSITSVEAFVLGLMAVIVVAIGIPSYVTMRDRANDSAARAQVREAVDAVETYRAESGSYAGLSVAALVRVDPELSTSGLALARPAADGYCVQATVGGRTWHAGGAAGQIARGRCP